MTKALYASVDDIKAFTSIDGNMDHNKITQFIDIAQDLHVIPLLGTDLHNEMQDALENDNRSADELVLHNTYLRPLTIHYAMVEILPFAAFEVSNNGVYKPTPENGQVAEKEDVDFLIEKHRAIASKYAQRMYDYLCHNEDKFPAYSTNTDEDIDPIKPEPFGGWQV